MLYKETELLASDWTKVPLTELLDPHKKRKLRGFSYNPRSNVVEFCDFIMPRRTKPVKQILKVTLEDGSNVYCAGDLKFLREDLTYVEASHLVVGTRLLGVKSISNQKTYVVKQLDQRARDMTPAMVSSVRFNNFALGCGVFVHS